VSQRTVGTILCILSACSYGATGIFGKLAFDEGLTVTGLLAARFSIAAIVLWLLVAALGRGSRPSRRGAAAGIALGVVAYSAQTGLFFLALTRLDAGLAVLLVYIAPVLVAIAAVAFGREQLSRAQVAAVVVAVCGTALVATGGGLGKVDGLGMVFAFGCAVAFTAYMLLSHAVVGRVNPVALSASVCTGCALSFLTAAGASGHLPIHTTGKGWLLVGALALFSTVIAVTTLAAGTARIGPSTATILATFEPVIATILAVVILGERLAALQVVGGLLVLASALIVSVRRRTPLHLP
jgi:drug/metabolite transporter (DMT)-like permease